MTQVYKKLMYLLIIIVSIFVPYTIIYKADMHFLFSDVYIIFTIGVYSSQTQIFAAIGFTDIIPDYIITNETMLLSSVIWIATGVMLCLNHFLVDKIYTTETALGITILIVFLQILLIPSIYFNQPPVSTSYITAITPLPLPSIISLLSLLIIWLRERGNA